MSHEIHVQARGGLIDPNFDSINTNTGIDTNAIGSILCFYPHSSV